MTRIPPLPRLFGPRRIAVARGLLPDSGSLNGDPFVVIKPNGYGPTTPVIIAVHGALEDQEFFQDSLHQSTREALLAAGYAIACPYLGGNNWGNTAALNKLAAFYSYVGSRGAPSQITMYGESMGGLVTLLALADARFAAIPGAYLVDPVCDLAEMYYGSFVAQIDASYDNNYPSAAVGHNPALLAGSSWSGKLLRFTASGSDTIAPKADHADVMRPIVAGNALEYSLRVHGGAHVHSASFDADDIADFYARCVTGATAFNPASLSSLEFWLSPDTGIFEDTAGSDAAEVGDGVARANSANGSGRNLQQSTSGQRPPLGTEGNSRVFEFSAGSSHTIKTASAAWNQLSGDFTIFGTTKNSASNPNVLTGSYDSSGNNWWVGAGTAVTLSINGGTNIVTSGVSVGNGEKHTFCVVRSGSAVTIYVDNVQYASGTLAGNAAPSADWFVGYFGLSSFYHTGDVNHLLKFSRALTRAERTQLHDYAWNHQIA